MKIIRRIIDIISIVYLKTRYLSHIKISVKSTMGKNVDINIEEGDVIIGNNFRTRNNFSIIVTDGGRLEIGSNCFFNNNCSITALNRIFIGNNCTFGNNLVIVDHDHDLRAVNKFSKGSVIIEENTWVGANVTILKDTTIGKNCVIGAGCVVSGAIPDNTILIQKRNNILKERI